MSSKSESESENQPVYVIETIPIGGDHEVAPVKSNPRASQHLHTCVCTANSVAAAWAAFTPRRIATCCVASL